MSYLTLTNEKKNWQLAAIYIEKTTDVMQPHIKTTLTRWYENLPSSSRTNFINFMKKVNTRKKYVYYNCKYRNGRRGTWDVNSSDPTDKQILEKILSLHTNPYYSNIQFKSNSWGECNDIEPYWILAKIFMPYGNKESRTPSDSDPLSIFDLLRNCRCFSSEFDRKCLDELCTARYLIKTQTSLSPIQMKNIVDSMRTLLQASCLKPYDCRVSSLIDELETLLKGSTPFITSMDLDLLKESMAKYCEDEITTIELKEGVNDLYNWLLHSGMEHLRQEMKKELEEMDEKERKKNTYVRIGGMAGYGVVGTSAAAIGATVAFTLGAPVTIAAVGVGMVSGIFGYIGGRAGGRVIGDLDRITDNPH